MSDYRHLGKGEVIQEGDEIDRCADPFDALASRLKANGIV